MFKVTPQWGEFEQYEVLPWNLKYDGCEVTLNTEEGKINP